MSNYKLINKDFTKARVPSNSVDLIVTSPPYNLDMPYDQHKDVSEYEVYKKWSAKWLATAHRVLISGGRLCLNIPLDTNKGGQRPFTADLTTIAMQQGFKYHSTIVWAENNISRRTAWGSWLKATAPYVIAPVETIVILYKDEWNRGKVNKANQGRKSGISRDEFIAWTNGLWEFNGESAKRIGHPAPFPVALAERCIKLFSFESDMILDPFMGSGTTAIAALKNKRTVIGTDISQQYIDLAHKRIAKEVSPNEQ